MPELRQHQRLLLSFSPVIGVRQRTPALFQAGVLCYTRHKKLAVPAQQEPPGRVGRKNHLHVAIHPRILQSEVICFTIMLKLISGIYQREKIMRKLTSVVLMIGLALQVIGCSASKTTKGTAIGTGSGAVVGGVIGKQLGNTALGAILGAAIGGAAGSYIGHRMDKQAEELQKELAEAEVNRVGEGIQVTLKSGLLFDTNKSTLQPAAKTELQEFAGSLNKYPDTILLIEGHADSQGEEAYNQTLSEQRASTVANFLIQQKVDPARITTKGYGETQPKMSNDTAEGRAANRRVEIVIVANDKLKQEAVANTKS